MLILQHSVKIDTKYERVSVSNDQKALNAVKANIQYNHDVKGLKRCDYNLIFMDCNMPFMDGYEAT